jgi:hypothetical protein
MDNTVAEHEKDYIKEIWREYTVQELANWVGLLCKRATMRSEKERAIKDLRDARNYLYFLEQKVGG